MTKSPTLTAPPAATVVTVDVAAVERLILNKLNEFSTSHLPGYAEVRQLLRDQPGDVLSWMGAATGNLAARGDVELAPGLRTAVRLPRRQAIEIVLTQRLIYGWLERRNAGSAHRMLREVGVLLADQLDHALAFDARGTFEAAIAATAPRMIAADARLQGRRALQATTLTGTGTVAPKALLRTMLAIQDFPGRPADLVDICLAALTDPRS